MITIVLGIQRCDVYIPGTLLYAHIVPHPHRTSCHIDLDKVLGVKKSLIVSGSQSLLLQDDQLPPVNSLYHLLLLAQRGASSEEKCPVAKNQMDNCGKKHPRYSLQCCTA